MEATKELSAAAKLQSSAIEVDLRQQRLYARGVASESASSARAELPKGGSSQHPSANEEDFEALVQKATAAYAAGQMDAAIPYYQRALALRQEWEEGWRNLGTLYYGAARYPEAVTAFKNSAAANAGNGNVWALLGLSEFETRDYQNAIIHLQRGRDLGFAGNPAAVQIAKYHLALLLNRNGDFDRTTELLTPESGAGPVKEQIKFALGIALLRIAKLPEEIDPAKSALVRAAGETAALLVESKYDQAFSRFQKLIKEYPDTPYLHYAYGTALASASQYDEAEQQLSEESKITPGSALPLRRRAAIALQLRNSDKALQLAQRAVQIDAESGEGHYLSGRAWLELGKTEDAIAELETARQLVPNSPEVHFNLARAYEKSGRSADAEQERGVFERLNASVQRQRSMRGSQAYGALQNENGIQAAEGQGPAQASARPK